MMYARAYAGPSWNGDNKDKVLASKTADAVDLEMTETIISYPQDMSSASIWD